MKPFHNLRLSLFIFCFALLIPITRVEAGTPVKLKIISSPQTMLVNQCSGLVTVQSQDTSSLPASSTSNRTLKPSGPYFTFYKDALCAVKISSVSLPAGQTNASFYFKSSLSGYRYVSVSSSGLTSTKQLEKISAGNLAPRPITYPLYGVTMDDIYDLDGILQSLQNLSHRPTTRVVFDEWVKANYYQNAVSQISQVSFVMGEILDSFYVKRYSQAQYSQRVTEYLDTLGNTVDIWEVGNEINGEWLGDTATVMAKVSDAYQQVKNRGGKTAITLYYNEECWSDPDNEMFTWANANIPDSLKFDYVLVSYYEEDCNGLRPDWPMVFQALATMFPDSKIGFGEVGTTNIAEKADFLNRYYKMVIDEPNYVGGYFWWYFYEDMVPWTAPLWNALNGVIE